MATDSGRPGLSGREYVQRGSMFREGVCSKREYVQRGMYLEK
jgi:hypothetical protein